MKSLPAAFLVSATLLAAGCDEPYEPYETAPMDTAPATTSPLGPADVDVRMDPTNPPLNEPDPVEEGLENSTLDERTELRQERREERRENLGQAVEEVDVQVGEEGVKVDVD